MSYPMAMLVLAGLGGILVLMGLAFFLRPRWLLGWIKGMFVIVLVGGGLYGIAVAMQLRHYQALSHMETIGSLRIEAIGDQTWRVRLDQPGEPAENWTLSGDEWQLDARIIRFGGPFGWLGVSPGYRLERISGRYHSLEQERNDARTVEAVGEQGWPDLWEMDQAWNLPFMEGIYGSATYMPFRDGALYDVRLSSSGLVTVPVNEEARSAVRFWDEE
ncbi:multidrug transporter [Marinobacter sp. M1N3S26]|uniref:multidrug transporter n=1 Tax=Marinobacter sp. M1N3S26 TaxID=3382299 RepID=UPI00387B8A43